MVLTLFKEACGLQNESQDVGKGGQPSELRSEQWRTEVERWPLGFRWRA